MKLPRTISRFGSVLLALTLAAVLASAAEQRLVAPGGKLAVVVSDDKGLNFRVEIGGNTVVARSPLGLEFEGAKLGPSAAILQSSRESHDSKWENRFGNNRLVRDRYKELRLTLGEQGAERRAFGLIVRAYDGGVAFRYDLPLSSGLGSFVLTNELTEFHFAEDYPCWAGGESASAENPYPATKLSAIAATNRQGASLQERAAPAGANAVGLSRGGRIRPARLGRHVDHRNRCGGGEGDARCAGRRERAGGGLRTARQSVARVDVWKHGRRTGRLGLDRHPRRSQQAGGCFLDQAGRHRVGCLVDGNEPLRPGSASHRRERPRHHAVSQRVHRSCLLDGLAIPTDGLVLVQEPDVLR